MTREEVKALIAEKITTNGEGAITAEVLAEVLNAVVDEGVLDASHLNRGDEISEDFAQKMRNAKELVHPIFLIGKGLKITSLNTEMIDQIASSARSMVRGANIVSETIFGLIEDEQTSITVCAAATAYISGEHKYYFLVYDL